MKYWIIADTHFGHTKMHEYCQRPEGFEGKIFEQIERTVGPDDILIHLGDFSVGRDAYWHEIFMDACIGGGFKWLIRGNHDRKSNTWYHRNGWDFVAEQATLNLFGKTIVLSHIPISCAIDSINVHGHQHNTGHHPENMTDGRHRLVFIEHEYTPINLRRIIEG